MNFTQKCFIFPHIPRFIVKDLNYKGSLLIMEQLRMTPWQAFISLIIDLFIWKRPVSNPLFIY